MTKIRDEGLLKEFGLHLKKIREAKQLTQEELAYAADVPINQIGRIERGEVNTTISTMATIANALKISKKELMDF